MADKYGTDCGVKGMKNYLHIFIKGAFVLFLIAYLTRESVSKHRMLLLTQEMRKQTTQMKTS